MDDHFTSSWDAKEHFCSPKYPLNNLFLRNYFKLYMVAQRDNPDTTSNSDWNSFISPFPKFTNPLYSNFITQFRFWQSHGHYMAHAVGWSQTHWHFKWLWKLPPEGFSSPGFVPGFSSSMMFPWYMKGSALIASPDFQAVCSFCWVY